MHAGQAVDVLVRTPMSRCGMGAYMHALAFTDWYHGQAAWLVATHVCQLAVWPCEQL